MNKHRVKQGFFPALSPSWAVFIWAGFAAFSHAQGPHEIALIVNQNNPDSLAIAHQYAHLRRVPSANIIYLNLPRDFGGIRGEIPPDQFQQLIFEPVRSQIAARRIDDHILAWIYSAGFPVRVLTQPPISLHGATFVRGQYPPGEAVDKAQFLSPFWRGPDKPGAQALPSGTLQDFAVALQQNMPLPSASIGYTANRGLTVEETVDSLRRAIAADGSRPKDPVFFHLSEDIRSTSRRWQFDDAANELKLLGVPTLISSNVPSPSQPLSGLMVGVAYTDAMWGRLQPGSIADNLTSFGAEFFHQDQVRLSHWLRTGASIASGTVTEPYAAWPKFAHARIFAHYARGCTALESYMQALRSPLQQFLVGDPLARPWGRPIPLTLISMEDASKPLRGEVSFLASSIAQGPGLRFIFLLDGRTLPTPGTTPGIRFDSRAFSDGWHELHAIAYSAGPVRQQGHARLECQFDNFGRFARLSPGTTNTAVDLVRPFSVRVACSPGATGMTITAYERVIWSGPPSTQAVSVVLRPSEIGAGPVTLHAVAHFPDGMEVRSPPVRLSIQRLNRPPRPPQLVQITNQAGIVQARVESTDPDGDPVRHDWFSDRLFNPPKGVNATADGWTLSDTGRVLIAKLPSLPDTEVSELVLQLRTADTGVNTGPLVGGIAWNIRDNENYAYFGWHWQWNGWAVGKVQGGAFHPIHARGLPRTPRGTETVSIQNTSTGLVINIDGDLFVHLSNETISGPIGLVGGPIPWTLTMLAVKEKPPEFPPHGGRWLVRATDGFDETWARWRP